MRRAAVAAEKKAKRSEAAQHSSAAAAEESGADSLKAPAHAAAQEKPKKGRQGKRKAPDRLDAELGPGPAAVAGASSKLRNDTEQATASAETGQQAANQPEAAAADLAGPSDDVASIVVAQEQTPAKKRGRPPKAANSGHACDSGKHANTAGGDVVATTRSKRVRR